MCRMGVPVEGTEAILASLIAFDKDSKAALMQLGKGDAISVAGTAKLSSWTGRDGAEKHGPGITVTRVMSIYESGMRRREARNSQEDKRAAFMSGRVGSARNPAPLADLQDDLPWQAETTSA